MTVRKRYLDNLVDGPSDKDESRPFGFWQQPSQSKDDARARTPAEH